MPNIVVNDSFAAEIGPEGVTRYVAVLDRVWRECRGGDPDESKAQLEAGLAQAGIAIDAMSLARLNEQLIDPEGGELFISNDAGQTLRGDPDVDLYATEKTGLQSEPEDPDRPPYS